MVSPSITPVSIDSNRSLRYSPKRQGSSGVIPPLAKRLDAYKRLQELSARGKSTHELVITISKGFGVNQGTVYAWTKGTSPFGTRCGRITYTKELFYVIGALLGDGCVYHWRNTFQIWLLGEREFCEKYAEKVSRCINSRDGKFHHYKPYPYPGRNVWYVKFQNAELYFLFREIRENLSVLTKLLRSGKRSVNGLELVEGFFDAEGCVKVVKERVRKTPKINLDFSNTNLPLLELIRRELNCALGIEGRFTSQQDTRSNRQVNYHLRIYAKDAIRRFLFHVNTTKLKADKVAYVQNWLRKNRKDERAKERRGVTSLPSRI